MTEKSDIITLNINEEFDLTWFYNRISKLYMRHKKYGTQRQATFEEIARYLKVSALIKKNEKFYNPKYVEPTYPLQDLWTDA